MKSGVLIVQKAAGMTSHDVVSAIRRLFHTKKVGHAGTLDPNATGVLPVLVGNAVKASDLLPDTEKVYVGSVRFGASFDTEDVWGNLLAKSDVRPTEADFFAACQAMTGPYDQVPPMVSAVKLNGKKLYEYARAGQTVERVARRVEIHSIELLSFTPEEATLRVACSKGTYIRTLLVDLAARCGALGAMSALCREKSCGFRSERAVTLARLEQLTEAEREAALVPTEELFLCYPALSLPPFFDRLIANGCAVEQRKLQTNFAPGQRVRLYRDGAFFALGEAVEKDGLSLLKKIKDFPPDPMN